MNWKDRLTKVCTVRGIPIYDNGYYIINGGDSKLFTVPVSAHSYVVKINKLDLERSRLWFNDNLDDGNAYTWNYVYEDYIVREATQQEIEKWKRYYKK